VNDPLLIVPIFLITTIVFGWLATTSRPRNQWIGWSVAWAMQLVLYVSFFPVLSQPNS
jgi:small-conductance mechanosensitive channel